MIVVLFLLSLIGGAIASIAIAIVATHFILNGVEALVMRKELAKDNKSEGHYNNEYAVADTVPTYRLNIHRCDLYEVIRSHINKVSSDSAKNRSSSQERNANTDESHRYINQYPPCLTQHPLPFPIKHTGHIVNKLRRRVNHSGKEPIIQANLTSW